jgi:hypothetical protein
LVTKKEEAVQDDPWQDNPVALTGQVSHVEDSLSVTLKAGTGYDAPWLVFKTPSVEQALAYLKHPDLDELMDLTARKGGGSWGNKTTAVSQASTDVPSGTCPSHNCDLVYVEPFKKRDGSEISARVACPVPKCYAKTFWHNKDGSWTEK